jgi:hypothetical protein
MLPSMSGSYAAGVTRIDLKRSECSNRSLAIWRCDRDTEPACRRGSASALHSHLRTHRRLCILREQEAPSRPSASGQLATTSARKTTSRRRAPAWRFPGAAARGCPPRSAPASRRCPPKDRSESGAGG